MNSMKKPSLLIILISAALPLSTNPAPAQVDAIPDPHQDFYERSRPKKPPEIIQSPALTPDVPVMKPQEKIPAKPAVNDLDDAMSVPDNSTKTAPDQATSTPADAATSTPSPAVTHPELMPRPPIPTPPAVSLLAPLNGGQLKDNLSWRTRAYKLRSESPDAHGGLVKASRLVNASFEDTTAAVTAACSAKGFVIDDMYDSAGQILAHPADSAPERSRIIISVKPISKTTTLVRIGLDADNRSRQNTFDDLLNYVESSISDKGLL